MNASRPPSALAVFVSGILAFETSGYAARNVSAPKPPLPPAVFKPLQAALLDSYEDLFQKAPKLEFSVSQIEKMREYLDQARKHCTGRFEDQAKQLDDNLRNAQTRLRRPLKRGSFQSGTTLHSARPAWRNFGT